MRNRPALVISLDFELLWGVRDHITRDSPYVRNLLGARDAIPGILKLFERYQIAATWATVGLLFARTREEQRSLWPQSLPNYCNRRHDPYLQDVGFDEQSDPLCFGADLIAQIQATPRQEIGTHTFSHFLCGEPGPTLEDFVADLQAAIRAAERSGAQVLSIVFPRNQVHSRYLERLAVLGIRCFRDRESNWGNRWLKLRQLATVQRLYRLLDSYVDLSGANSSAWGALKHGELIALPASRFLRPCTGCAWLDRMQLKRIERAMEHAALTGEVFHLWWHPHNFGHRTESNLKGLASILKTYDTLRQRHGMLSLTMAEAASRAHG